MGKTTLIQDFTKLHPEYKHEVESYYKLQEEKSIKLALEPSLDSLDMIVFLPITKEHLIEYTEDENPIYRKTVDRYFKKIYRDDVLDIFPSYGHPKIVEIYGNRTMRLKKLETYIIK